MMKHSLHVYNVLHAFLVELHCTLPDMESATKHWFPSFCQIKACVPLMFANTPQLLKELADRVLNPERSALDWRYLFLHSTAWVLPVILVVVACVITSWVEVSWVGSVWEDVIGVEEVWVVVAWVIKNLSHFLAFFGAGKRTFLAFLGPSNLSKPF